MMLPAEAKGVRMPETVTLQEAQAHLAELIAKRAPGEELIITHEEKPVAELRILPPEQPQPRFGNCRGKLVILAEDDDHLKDFADYMP
jgi:antitoxin (DNA-binding transcriptional repressor) of toxin-antitoxin stability system